jgi:probable F420-dependent oxidoreductase
MVVLSYAAALTRRIRLGVAVVVLPVHAPAHIAHQLATLDHLSNGRAILGVGVGRPVHYADFGVPTELRVRRFTEGLEIIRALWTQDTVDLDGDIYQLHGAQMALKPAQAPHPPIWIGGAHANAIRRAVRLGDGWIGSGNQTLAGFRDCIRLVRDELDRVGRDPATFAISKRVFLSVHDDPAVARAETDRWFTDIYHNPELSQASGVCGTPSEVTARLEELKAAGLNHLLLNPIARDAEHLDVLASMTGLDTGEAT